MSLRDRTTGGDARVRDAAVPSGLERAVLLTVLYADVFDYALAEDDLFHRLVACPADRVSLRRALRRLTGPYLSVVDGYVTWRGREHLASVRERRREAARVLWPAARRYAGWLAHVPFVRMVAVSGSLAVENAEGTSDVDLFCITAPRRLWVARLCIVPLSRLTRALPGRFPRYLCPNYLLAEDALEVEDRNLFTAYEVAQSVPLWGASTFGAFVEANAWAGAFLPNRGAVRLEHVAEPAPGGLVRACERLLGGRLGDALDGLAYRAFVAFYRRRAERRGWGWAHLARAYGRSRYTVPEGGYVHVVRRLFLERVRRHLGALVTEHDLDSLFARTGGPPERPVYDWEQQFAADYGAAGGGREDAARA